MQKQIFKDAYGIEHEHDGFGPVAWRISGYAIVRRGDDILCVKQESNEKYELPGGGIEVCESLVEGVEREFIEEVGIAVEIPEEVKPFYMHDSQFYNEEQEPKFFHSICLYYEGFIQDELPPQIGGPIEQVWVDVDHLPEVVFSVHHKALERYLKSQTSRCIWF